MDAWDERILIEQVLDVRTLLAAMRTVESNMAAHAGRGLPRLSEADTKRILIQPLLAGLGWDVMAGTDLRMEYPVRRRVGGRTRYVGYADYALIVRGRVTSVVEAKSMGHDLDDLDVTQAVGYAQLLGARSCLLTNGREYELHFVHPETRESLLIGTAELGVDDTETVASLLARLSKGSVGDFDATPWVAPVDVPTRAGFVEREGPLDATATGGVSQAPADAAAPDEDDTDGDGLLDLGGLVLECIGEARRSSVRGGSLSGADIAGAEGR